MTRSFRALLLALALLAPLIVLKHNASATSDPLYGLRMCESENNYAIDTGNGYYGAYQFSLATWQWVGGEGYPHMASPEEQDARAWQLLTRYGPHHWPKCQYRIVW